MEKITLKDIASYCSAYTDSDLSVCGISTDSRTVEPGELFVAIEGESFDGHDYCKKAVENGAAAVLAHKKVDCDVPVINVKNTTQALLDIAGGYRRRFNIPVIALTGSVGKTTTKGMIYTVLSSAFRTLRTEGNLNNEIWVLKTICGFDGTYSAAVLEMGMNHSGEISKLSLAGAPTAAVITNIGVAHIGNLGSREGILAAKLEILDGMAQDAPLILNGDDDMLSGVESDTRKIIYYGINNPKCSFTAENITAHDDGMRFTAVCGEERADFFVPVPGKHNVYNALAAAAAGSLCGISLNDAAKAIKNFKVEGMRQRVGRVGTKTFIEDCYNSNPDSMRAAIDTLVSLKGSGRAIIVMGDMLELGEISEKAHADIGRHAASAGADVLLGFGEYTKAAVKSALESGIYFSSFFTDKHELANTLYELLRDGDCVLFKGSRSMKTEDIAEEIKERIEVSE